MSSFQIIVGSMLGASEYVAEACQEALEALGHQATLHFKPNFYDIAQQNQTWLICTSTHGAGEYPDNIQGFVRDLQKDQNDLSTVTFLVIALGNSSYDTFCQAGKNITNLLISKGYKKSVELKMLDVQQGMDPEEEARSWLLANKDLL